MRALLLGLCLLGLSGCSGWLFYPEREMLLNPAEVGLAYEDVFITAADGTRLHAWWLPAKAGVAVKGTVLHLHGMAAMCPVIWRAAGGCRLQAIRCCCWITAVMAVRRVRPV
jgi:hypothetical protein